MKHIFLCFFVFSAPFVVGCADPSGGSSQAESSEPDGGLSLVPDGLGESGNDGAVAEDDGTGWDADSGDMAEDSAESEGDAFVSSDGSGAAFDTVEDTTGLDEDGFGFDGGEEEEPDGSSSPDAGSDPPPGEFWEDVVFVGGCPDDPTCENTVFVDVTAGMFHSCAVTDAWDLLCWGDNKDGQSEPPEGNFVRVWAGWEQTCGLLADGHVLCWGFNSQGQSSPPQDEVLSQLDMGRSHVCGVNTDQQLVCWGEDHEGMTSPPAGFFKQAAVGRYYSCGLSIGGEVTCFGDDSQGTLSGVLPGPFSQISSGRWHVCGLREDGEVACWGNNELGQLDAPPGPFVQLDAGWTHTCALRSEGPPVCWGEPHQGLTPPPEDPGPWSWVSAGDGHNCGLVEGTLRCWGSPLKGQIFVPGDDESPFAGCAELDCDDGNLCTVDSCLEAACFYNLVQCDDGDPCTGVMGLDTCNPETGLCEFPVWWDCDDGNECTYDLCDGIGGCSHSPVFDFCDDGDPCTLGDQCANSMCVSGPSDVCDEVCLGAPAPNCDDGDECTTDYCDSELGCIQEIIPGCN